MSLGSGVARRTNSIPLHSGGVNAGSVGVLPDSVGHSYLEFFHFEHFAAFFGLFGLRGVDFGVKFLSKLENILQIRLN